MERKGFTLVELLVVITIIALLMSILMPVLGRVRQLAYRVMCGTNLSAMGKQIIMYSNYNDDRYPMAGNKKAEWGDKGGISDWDTTIGPKEAYGGLSDNEVTITSSLFLLIKYADATPKQFICKGDSGAEVFKLSDFRITEEDFEIEDAWDFGDEKGQFGTLTPGEYCSYTYHMPYWFEGDLPWQDDTDISFAISPMSSSGCPLSSDRNPYMDSNAGGYLDDIKLKNPEWKDNAYYDPDKKGNCAAHQREGQNVLFNDTHVSFEKYPNVGIDNDNIYKYWPVAKPTATQKQLGTSGVVDSYAPTEAGDTQALPMGEKDALLVGEEN